MQHPKSTLKEEHEVRQHGETTEIASNSFAGSGLGWGFPHLPFKPGINPLPRILLMTLKGPVPQPMV